MTFTLAIVGRPNVGKSTLFNRLVGRRLAIVDDTPGVTRDRREGVAVLGDLTFTVIDTAGLEEAKEGELAHRMRQQTEAAIAAADVCLFLIDARAGVTPLDEDLARILRKGATPVILAANKCEGREAEAGRMDAFRLGLGEPIALSAEHGEGTSDLYAALMPYGEKDEPEDDEFDELDDEPEARPEGPLRLAVVGRPNAGKSTLINKLIGEDRLLTGPEAGITRDAISVEWEADGAPVMLWDTAGLRRRARVTEKLEKLSVADTLRAVRFAEVVVLMIDAAQPFEKQDLQIADLVVAEGRAIVVAINKWDLVEDRAAALKELNARIDELLPQVKGVETVTISAQTGQGLDKLMPAVRRAQKRWCKRLSTAELNRWLEVAVERHPPPAVQGRRIRLRYMTQPKSRPPTFVIFSQRAEKLPDAYTRYLVNGIRERFDLQGTPIRINLRKGDNPYANQRKRRGVSVKKKGAKRR